LTPFCTLAPPHPRARSSSPPIENHRVTGRKQYNGVGEGESNSEKLSNLGVEGRVSTNAFLFGKAVMSI
jgi:hypothetical protein